MRSTSSRIRPSPPPITRLGFTTIRPNSPGGRRSESRSTTRPRFMIMPSIGSPGAWSFPWITSKPIATRGPMSPRNRCT